MRIHLTITLAVCVGLALVIGCRTEQVAKIDVKIEPVAASTASKAMVRVTQGTELEGFPSVSLDGDEVAFVRFSKDVKQADIYSINIQGQGASKRITQHMAIDSAPVWYRLPRTGEDVVVFDSNRTAMFSIWERSATGAGASLQIVPDDPFYHYSSPDVNRVNGKIAFVRTTVKMPMLDPLRALRYGVDARIVVCDHDGRNVTDFAHGVCPRWSPDGKRLAFAKRGTAGRFDIWVVNADGSEMLQITQHVGDEIEPAWSPDGSALAFCANRVAGVGWRDKQRFGDFDIWLASLKTGKVVQLTSAGPFEGWPAFAANGDIYFHSFSIDAEKRVSAGVWRVTPEIPGAE